MIFCAEFWLFLANYSKKKKDKDFFGCSPLLLIRPGASQVQIFFVLAMNQFDWPIIQKMKLWMLPKIEGFILKYNVHRCGPTYIGERMTTFAKTYAIKARVVDPGFLQSGYLRF